MSQRTRRWWWLLVVPLAFIVVLFVWLDRSDSGSKTPPSAAIDNPPSAPIEEPGPGPDDDGASTTSTIGSGIGDKTSEAPTVRDSMFWPYPWNSIWNVPVGDRADLVPFEMTIPTARTLNIEEDILIIAPDEPGRDIVKHDAAWRDGVTRCDSRNAEILASNIPIPDGWVTDPDYSGRKPNHSAAILMPDMTLFETQPFHICEDGIAVSQFTNGRWQGDSILTGGMGAPDGGSHGGSFMTAFGGTIRLGEWVPNGAIRHVLKIDVYSRENLSPIDGGYRWPALRADTGYDHPDKGYAGNVPEAKMGALLALPSDFDVESLQSEPARILARALQRFGAYVVDGTGWSTAAFATEWGPQGRVMDEFQQVWGFPIVGDKDNAGGRQREFLEGIEVIYAELHVVDDNTPGNTGGAGERLAPWAPPFADGTGGHP